MTEFRAKPGGGTLTLVSTPIGNLGDVTLRALEVLSEADGVLAEDTRRSRKLLSHHNIHVKAMIAYHDHNKERLTPRIIDRLRSGQNLALVSDAGTPGVSDPGFYLVRAALSEGLSVTAVPGANAILPALILSGFPTDSFIFEGFPPRKSGDLVRAVEELVNERRTVIYFVSPHRLRTVLKAIADRLPERMLAVVRELTKMNEEVVRGTAADLLKRYTETKVRGEIVLLVKGVGRRGKSRPART